MIEDVPLTYRGEYLNVDHYVDVRIDIPWRLDPTGSKEFLVLPGGIQEIDEPWNPAPSTTAISTGCAILILLLSLIFYLVYLVSADEAKQVAMWMRVGLLVLFIYKVGARIIKRLRENKRGLVTVEMDTCIVTPNMTWTLRV